MKEKLDFVRLPILLFVIFFIGRLALGAEMGVSKASYDLSNRLFSMVILEVHVGLLGFRKHSAALLFFLDVVFDHLRQHVDL